MKTKSQKRLLWSGLALTFVLGAALTVSVITAGASDEDRRGHWVAGDFHTHTYLTDGNRTEKEVVANAAKFGLNWMANSEHGGFSSLDPNGKPFLNNISLARWITLRDYSFPIIEQLRAQYTDMQIVQGVEWNVPKHEHASVAIVNNEPKPVSDFEYIFDAGDTDTSRAAEGIVKHNVTLTDAATGAAWLENNYPKTSYFLPNHPSRKLLYSVADLRDFNNVAPDVAFGFEGIPGHQREASRGGYTGSNPKAQTYGGADYMVAKVGGLWDSLLGEGRHFWTFTNSDFHDTPGDFWPGEYSKSYTMVNGKGYKDLVDGMRSGNSYAVLGDLINGLDFSVKGEEHNATMGDTLKIEKGKNAQIQIRFKSPAVNNNGDAVTVNHIDLIAGDVTGKTNPGTAAYTKDTNDSTKVIARFTSSDWKSKDGWNEITFQLKDVEKDQYFRLRGTNLGLNVANETDTDGNPLVDNLVGPNDAGKAYKDLWFYSNPIFVSVSQ